MSANIDLYNITVQILDEGVVNVSEQRINQWKSLVKKVGTLSTRLSDRIETTKEKSFSELADSVVEQA
jgi:mRNA-degrading endonuclease toxin of MazEF toxin-antitoxin module